MAGAFVMLREDMRSGEGGMMMMWGGGNRVRDDGTFELSNVTPGDYVLEARPMMMGPPRRGDGDPEAAFASVSVGGEDVTGVALMGTKGTSIRGHVVMQPAAAVGGVKPSEISVNAMAKNADAPMLFMGGEMRDRLEDDWTFELKAVQSPVLIRSFRLPPGYTLKSVTLNGVDVTDSGIAFKTNEPITGVQVVLSNTSTTVTGTVTDDTGARGPRLRRRPLRRGQRTLGIHVALHQAGTARSAGRLPGEGPAAGPLPRRRGRDDRERRRDRPGAARTHAVDGDAFHPERRRAARAESEARSRVLTYVNHRDTENTEDTRRTNLAASG